MVRIIVLIPAQAIQAASGLRVWVALTKDYFMGVPDIQQVPEAVQMAMEELLRAGMTSKKYIGVGHGLAGESSMNCSNNKTWKINQVCAEIEDQEQELKM